MVRMVGCCWCGGVVGCVRVSVRGQGSCRWWGGLPRTCGVESCCCLLWLVCGGCCRMWWCGVVGWLVGLMCPVVGVVVWGVVSWCRGVLVLGVEVVWTLPVCGLVVHWWLCVVDDGLVVSWCGNVGWACRGGTCRLRWCGVIMWPRGMLRGWGGGLGDLPWVEGRCRGGPVVRRGRGWLACGLFVVLEGVVVMWLRSPRNGRLRRNSSVHGAGVDTPRILLKPAWRNHLDVVTLPLGCAVGSEEAMCAGGGFWVLAV